jgi:hypothetical protein
MKLGVVVVAIVAGLALIGTYAALGGTSFRPSAVADPCAERPIQPTTTTAESLERVVLRAADTVACGLGVSREELVLSMRSVDRLERLATRQGVDRDQLEQALRRGLIDAADEAQATGLVGERTAGVLRAAAGSLPLSLLLAIVRGGSSLLSS